MRTSSIRFSLVCTLSLGLSVVCTKAATYLEIGGQVVVEAEHFDSRTVDTTDNHHWHVVPDDNTNPMDPLMDTPATYNELIWTNARGGKYVQSYPDQAGGGQNKNTDVSVVGTDAVLNYKVQIATTGQYRLYLRFSGYDGSSDSMYAQIVELIDGLATGQPDWYRYVGSVATADFSQIRDTAPPGGTAIGWNGTGAPEGDTANQIGGGGGEVLAVWTISTPGTYTIRISQREDGSALDAFVLQLASLPEPDDPGPDESPIVGSPYVRITQQPKDSMVANNQTATFTVVASSTGTPTYQWQKASPGSTNYTDILGATSASYTTPAATAGDDGTRFRVTASITGQSTTSRGARLTVDVTPPSVVRASGSSTFNKVTVFFSEPVDPASGTNTANYSLNGGLTVSSATISSGGTRVILTTSTQTTNAAYSVTVTNVTDLVGNVLSPNPSTANFTGWVLASGGVLHKFWDNITQNNIAGLTNNLRFPDNPTFMTLEPLFEYPPNGGGEAGDNYGNQLSGVLTAPLTGNYVFFTCSDDPSSLYLSTDENPANKKLIATETAWSNARQWIDTDPASTSDVPSKRSDQYPGTQWPTGTTITLTKGNRYYIEVLHTEGGGGDNVGVNWMLPGAGVEPPDGDPPISGTNVSFYYDPDGKVTITQQPQSANVPANSPVTFSVVATGLSSFGTNINYQWQRAPSGSSTFTDIAGANQAQYAIPFVLSADNGAQFRVAMTLLPAGVPVDNTRTTSAAATLTVTTDTTPPVVTEASGIIQTVRINFSEPLDQVSATASANYKIDQGVTVNSATVVAPANAAAIVQLAISGATAGKSYTVTINDVKDRANNAIAPNTTLSFIAYNAYYDFNDGQVPTGTAVGGSAAVLPTGGINSSGVLRLTEAVGSLQGGFSIPDLVNGAAVTNFTVTFKLFIGQGSGNPADGFSFNFATDVAGIDNTSEEGSGTGITVAFDTYNNAAAGDPAEAPAIGVKFGGIEFATTNLTKATLVNDLWVDVLIRLNGDGTLDVVHNGTPYYNKLDLTAQGYAPMAGATFLLGARTGGEFETHKVDNLAILENAVAAVLPTKPTITVVKSGGNLSVSWAPAGGRLQSTPALQGTSTVWTDVSSVNPANVAIGSSGNLFLRVINP